MKQTIYICIPISTGIGPEGNSFRQADEIQARLESAGYNVLNPHELCAHMPKNLKHKDYMAVCLPHVLRSDIVCTCDGWETSKGCRMEVNTAREYPEDIQIIHWSKLLIMTTPSDTQNNNAHV